MVTQVVLYSFGALTLLLLVLAQLRRNERALLRTAALTAAATAVAAHQAGFWSWFSLALATLFLLILALPWMDSGWRTRFSIVVVVTIAGAIELWPSIHELTGGKVACPAYLVENVTHKMVLGLDLQGGLRLVYTVDVNEALRDKRDHYYEQIQTELVRAYGLHTGDERPPESAFIKLREKVLVTAPRQAVDQIVLTFVDKNDVALRVDARFRDMFRGELGNPVVKDNVVSYQVQQQVASAIRERAVTQAREIVHRRVDELGLKEASVSTRDEDIIIEVPGKSAAEHQRIRDIVGQTARLEFKMVDDNDTFFEKMAAEARTNPEARRKLPEGLEFYSETAPVGQDASGERLTRTVTFVELTKLPSETKEQTLVRLREWAETLELPADRVLGYSEQFTVNDATLERTSRGWRTYLLKSRTEITGDMLRDAQAQPSQDTAAGGWHVSITFTDQGGRVFDRVTAEAVKRRFAILLDGRVFSAPEILSRISGGQAQITLGNQDPDQQLREARDLELVLRSGALPAPISPSNEQRIGSSLGADAARLGVRGAASGALLVVVFMLLYYRKAGIVASTSVGMNVFLQMAVLASFGASLTLPGICGLALTVGQGVDSNVLINERIREEIALGKSPRSAVELGFDRAFTAIFDGNLTSLLSGIVLWQYGVGPIKGFAVALVVGVLVSFFCGVLVTRVLFDFWVRGTKRGDTLDMG